ncbi:MAG: hypothetical protein ACLFTD_11035 [Halochromatium sp.]
MIDDTRDDAEVLGAAGKSLSIGGIEHATRLCDLSGGDLQRASQRNAIAMACSASRHLRLVLDLLAKATALSALLIALLIALQGAHQRRPH